jgi:hypothetical protein
MLKVMLAAQIGERLGGGPGAPCFYILVAVTHALDGFCKVLALPLQVGGRASLRAAVGSRFLKRCLKFEQLWKKFSWRVEFVSGETRSPQ